MKIAIIGTSKITNQHIDAFGNLKKNIISISSTRNKSKNLIKFKKKYKIKKIFYNWRESISYAKKFKDTVFFITARIEDNKKILKACCKTNNKIFIEKPIFFNDRDFKILDTKNGQIFVGYNRIFFNCIRNLKKKIKIKDVSNVIVKCPDENRKDIVKNSCHILSILFYLFGDLKLVQKNNRKNFISCILTNKKKTIINIFFNFNNSSNFSIEIFEKKKRYLMSPIENVKIFSGLEKIKTNSGVIYNPKKIFESLEYKFSKKKPGFVNQFKEFKNFVNGKKIYNNVNFARKIVKIANLIRF